MLPASPAASDSGEWRDSGMASCSCVGASDTSCCGALDATTVGGFSESRRGVESVDSVPRGLARVDSVPRGLGTLEDSAVAVPRGLSSSAAAAGGGASSFVACGVEAASCAAGASLDEAAAGGGGVGATVSGAVSPSAEAVASGAVDAWTTLPPAALAAVSVVVAFDSERLKELLE